MGSRAFARNARKRSNLDMDTVHVSSCFHSASPHVNCFLRRTTISCRRMDCHSGSACLCPCLPVCRMQLHRTDVPQSKHFACVLAPSLRFSLCSRSRSCSRSRPHSNSQTLSSTHMSSCHAAMLRCVNEGCGHHAKGPSQAAKAQRDRLSPWLVRCLMRLGNAYHVLSHTDDIVLRGMLSQVRAHSRSQLGGRIASASDHTSPLQPHGALPTSARFRFRGVSQPACRPAADRLRGVDLCARWNPQRSRPTRAGGRHSRPSGNSRDERYRRHAAEHVGARQRRSNPRRRSASASFLKFARS